MATVPSISRAAAAATGPASAPAEATRSLYEQFSRQIFAYCLVQLRNREEAEDAVQTTFLNAFRALERGVEPELESAWLYKIAQHVCLTRQRSWSRRRRIESPEDLETVHGLLGAPMQETGEVEGLTDALRTLPEQQRRAILLREWQGLTYKEIAEEMQLSQAAVETLIFRARRGLAQALERMRASSDMGSIVAAIKSLVVGAGTKVAVALLTVATTSVVAATPAARHQVLHLVNDVSRIAIAPTHVHPSGRAHKTAAPVGAGAAHIAPAPTAHHATIVTLARVAVPIHTAARHEMRPASVIANTSGADARASTPSPAPSAKPAGSSVADTTPSVTTPAVTPPTAAGSATPPPAIGGFSPTSGAPGTVVQLSGRGFTGATAVRFYGTSADYVVNSDTSITAHVPAGATSGPITVVSPTAGDITSTAGFTVTGSTSTTSISPSTQTAPAPAIGGFNPASGAPGTVVQLSGHGFTGATAVRFYGTSADYVVNSDTSITAHVPTGATSGPITVVSPTAGDITSTASFTVTNSGTSTTSGSTTTTTQTAPAPAIGGFSPASGAPGTVVQLSGRGFTGATAVRFYGTSADYVVNSDTSITADVPTGATSGPITVVSPTAGNITSTASFNVTAAAGPSIGGSSPRTGQVGASVLIVGSGFTGATSVKFNGTPATFTIGSDTQITATVPSGATTGPITVTTQNGTGTSTGSFTVSPPAAPAISGFNPGSGAVGASVEISGSGFAGATSVTFNGVSASFTLRPDGTIAAVVPTGATTGPVSVTTPNGTATSTALFTVTH